PLAYCCGSKDRQTLYAPSRGKIQAHDSDASRTISHATTTLTLATFILAKHRRAERHRPGLKSQDGFQHQQFNPDLLLPNRHLNRLPKSPYNLHPSRTKLDLPLWLAEMLAVSKPAGPASPTSLASLDMPFALGPRVLNALKADPKSVDVRAQAPWFYGLGERMLELFEDEEVGEVLLETFKQRALEIADKSQNTRAAMSQAGDSADFMSGLDETERQLFRAAHDGSNAVKKWFDVSSRSS
ncbi:hypothetical protein D0862_09927, partial [Hortaea werneckii]